MIPIEFALPDSNGTLIHLPDVARSPLLQPAGPTHAASDVQPLFGASGPSGRSLGDWTWGTPSRPSKPRTIGLPA